AAIAGLGHHRQAIVKSLKGVDLDMSLVFFCRLGLVFPDSFLFWCNLDDRVSIGGQQDVAIGQAPKIMARYLVVLPFDLALGVDDSHMPVVGGQDPITWRRRISLLVLGHGQARIGSCEQNRHENSAPAQHSNLLLCGSNSNKQSGEWWIGFA